MEVAANANGIDQVTSGVSPYEARVRAMMQQYPNLHFIACANSIRLLRERGFASHRFDHTDNRQAAHRHHAVSIGPPGHQ